MAKICPVCKEEVSIPPIIYQEEDPEIESVAKDEPFSIFPEHQPKKGHRTIFRRDRKGEIIAELCAGSLCPA
jgi:hypothetical protein